MSSPFSAGVPVLRARRTRRAPWRACAGSHGSHRSRTCRRRRETPGRRGGWRLGRRDAARTRPTSTRARRRRPARAFELGRWHDPGHTAHARCPAEPDQQAAQPPASTRTSSSTKATISLWASTNPRLRARDRPATGSTTRRTRASPSSSTNRSAASVVDALSTTITSAGATSCASRLSSVSRNDSPGSFVHTTTDTGSSSPPYGPGSPHGTRSSASRCARTTSPKFPLHNRPHDIAGRTPVLQVHTHKPKRHPMQPHQQPRPLITAAIGAQRRINALDRTVQLRLANMNGSERRGRVDGRRRGRLATRGGRGGSGRVPRTVRATRWPSARTSSAPSAPRGRHHGSTVRQPQVYDVRYRGLRVGGEHV